MTANIDAAPWTAKCVAKVGVTGASLVVFAFDEAIDSGHTQAITFIAATRRDSSVDIPPLTVGTYPLGGLPPLYGGGSEAALLTYCTPQKDLNSLEACAEWLTGSDPRSSGAITISTLTDHSASGTFTFTAPRLASTASVRLVTDGVFRVSF